MNNTADQQKSTVLKIKSEAQPTLIKPAKSK